MMNYEVNTLYCFSDVIFLVDGLFVCSGLSSVGQSLATLGDVKPSKPGHCHQFIGTACLAFCNRLGFVLAPQQLYLLIIQAISHHTSKHFDQLSGDKKIFDESAIEAKHEIETFDDSEWAQVINDLDAQTSKTIKPDIVSLFSTAEFSTARPAEIIAGKIAIMNMCESFIPCHVPTMCGIPEFILEGSLADWQLLRQLSEKIIRKSAYPSMADLWLPVLLPVLDKIIETFVSTGHDIDFLFWKSFLNRHSENSSCGFVCLSGWINAFFPYTSDGINKYFHCIGCRRNFI